jgi:hypothetical protein
MNMSLFYQRESGFPKLSMVTRIDLHFRTTSASLQLPSLQSTFGRLSHRSTHLPFASEYPEHVSTEYPKTLSCVHASRIISPSNVRHRLYMCCNTSVESSQTYQHISHNISETPRAPPCISEYYSFPKHDYFGYSTLFAHTTQTTTGSSIIFGHSPFDFLSTLDMMVHISESFYCTKIHTGTHSSIHPLRHLYSHCLKFSLDFGSIVKHTTSSPPFFEFIGTYLFLIDFFYLSVFISISFRISLDFFLLLLCFMFRTFVLSFLSFILLFSNIFEYLYTHVLVVSQ